MIFCVLLVAAARVNVPFATRERERAVGLLCEGTTGGRTSSSFLLPHYELSIAHDGSVDRSIVTRGAGMKFFVGWKLVSTSPTAASAYKSLYTFINTEEIYLLPLANDTNNCLSSGSRKHFHAWR